MKLPLGTTCTWGVPRGKINTCAAPGENLISKLSDRGSTPLASTKSKTSILIQWKSFGFKGFPLLLEQNRLSG